MEKQEDKSEAAEMQEWHGYPCQSFEFEGHEAFLVFPKVQSNGYLAVKTEYRTAFLNAVEIPLLENGFHLCYIRNDNRWGTDPDLERKARFIQMLQNKYGLKKRCVPIGMSCGIDLPFQPSTVPSIISIEVFCCYPTIEIVTGLYKAMEVIYSVQMIKAFLILCCLSTVFYCTVGNGRKCIITSETITKN